MNFRLKNIISTLAFLSLTMMAWSQDGKALFESRCNTCHLLGKRSTGPDLKGAKQKWVDAGEGELLYAWVKNSGNLLAAGNSEMAKAIEGFSPTTMAPQQVSNEEIDAILDYVDNYVKPEPKEEVATVGEPTVVVKQNYKANLKMFYVLLALTLIILLAIRNTAKATKTYVKSDYFKEKFNEASKNSKLNAIIVLVVASLMSAPTYALQFMGAGEATEDQPWLLVEHSDLITLMIINVILMGVLLYLNKNFKFFAGMTRSEEEVIAQPEESTLKKVNAVLTDVVPIEEEHTILMHHEYDGIKELDNNLPPWWVWMFIGTIIFGVVYVFHYHVLGTGDLQAVEYEKSIIKADAEVKEYMEKMAMNVDESSATLMTDASDLDKGKAIFDSRCASCHKVDGSGDIGPNLTDKYWIHGYEIGDVFRTVSKGALDKGMPAHDGVINPVEIQQVSSYVLHLKPVPGKDAEGDIVKE